MSIATRPTHRLEARYLELSYKRLCVLGRRLDVLESGLNEATARTFEIYQRLRELQGAIEEHLDRLKREDVPWSSLHEELEALWLEVAILVPPLPGNPRGR